MMDGNLPDLPHGWVWTRLGAVMSSLKGKKPKKLGPKSNVLIIPYIVINTFENRIFENYTDGSGCELCKEEDILVVWDGARCGLVGRGVSGAVGSTLAKLVLYKLNKLFIFFFLQSKYEYVNKNPKGVGIPHVDPNIFWNIHLPLPPLPEQQRIVAKIEELFTELDAGIDALKKVKTQLKRYRQAVLKYAFEGNLTEEWREMHKDELEPASVLLDRIKEERKKKWESGPMLPNMNDLIELPENWCWTKGDSIFSFVTSGSRGWARYYSNSGPIFIRMGNLNHNSITLDLSHTQRVQPPPKAEGTRSRIMGGDILISITADVGMTALVPEGIEEAYINQHVALARPISLMSASYVAWFLSSREGGQKQFLELQRGATKVGLGLDDIRAVNIPLSPLSEQHKIVEGIEQRFSVADEIEKTVENTLKQGERLRQSILKRAFEGKLVPQNPEDEPASILLERIKAEKAKKESENQRKSKKKSEKYEQKRLMNYDN